MPTFYSHMIGSFIYFLSHLPQGGADLEGGSLTDYLDEWVTDGDAIEITGGDHAVFLIGALFIAAYLTESPQSFGGYAERIQEITIFDPDRKPRELPTCLDPIDWKVMVFNYRHGRRR